MPALATALVLTALAGCGGGSAGSPTFTTTPAKTTPGPTVTLTTGTVTETVPEQTTPDRLRRVCGSGPQCDDFATPSGNIRCFATAANGGYVECDIRSGLTPPPSGTGCDLDQPGLVLAAAGRAAPDCRGDPTPAGLDRGIPALAYGAVWSGFGVTCRSRRAGLTCTNAAGRGFFLSRERWRTF
jgi:hypothetical protein